MIINVLHIFVSVNNTFNNNSIYNIYKMSDQNSKFRIPGFKNYKQLIERAYNYRFIDPAESDIAEYRAMLLMSEYNKNAFLDRQDDFNSIRELKQMKVFSI